MTMSRRPFPLSPPHSSQYSSPSSSHSHSSDPPNSSTTSPPPPPPIPAGGEVTPAFPKKAGHKPSFTPREDCWSEEATKTLIEAWGKRYLELKRGNLRQNHWQDVAAAVNALHALTPKLRRTDIQCKNRMDTVKKKYKIEKSRVSKSSSHYVSPWPFFSRLDFLLAPSFKPSPPSSTVVTRRRTPASHLPLPPLPPVVPVGRRSKRLAPEPAEDSAAKRRFSAMVLAAAEEPEEEEESDRSSYGGRRNHHRHLHHYHHGEREKEKGGGGAAEEGLRRLAEAIGRFGEIYERVEGEKQRQMVELEKQRMRFAKDLEIQRMKLFTDSQLQLERIHRAAANNHNPFIHSPTSRR